VDGKLCAAREWLKFDDAIRDELLELEDMGRVTAKVKDLVNKYGHSFKAEGERLYAEGIIDEHVLRELSAGG
jgi:defect-in-organelle-trafficking protein DotB